LSRISVTSEAAASFADDARRVRDSIEQVIRGKTEVIEQALTAFFAGGHLLVEDVPGLGKTTLARCLAASVGAAVGRIQFTPDLLPSDVTGVTMFDQRTHEFAFHPGPVFANVVLADEVNRASPKTQSALLEVMEERHVTVDGTGYAVPLPFMVVATQNPVDMAGTYALPEAQLDRFLMRLRMGYPDQAAEVDILRAEHDAPSPADLVPVLDLERAADMIQIARVVHVAKPIYHYVVALVAATRDLPALSLGASPRASVALLRAARARAAADARNYVVPEDVKALAPAVLAHRLLLSPDAALEGATTDEVVADVLRTVPFPRLSMA